MKPTKMRNNLIYKASYQTRSKQLGSALSKDLQKKYGKRSVRVTEGDSITITRGEFKGVDGKVASISTEKSAVAIEGVKKEKTKGDKFDVYIHTSNLMVTSLNTEDKLRMSKLERRDTSRQSKETSTESKETKVEIKDAPTESKETKVETKDAPTESKETKVETKGEES